MNRLVRWLKGKRKKKYIRRKPKRFVDMNHDDQIDAVKETMETVNYDGKDLRLTDNELTIIQCALSVYLNLLRGHIR